MDKPKFCKSYVKMNIDDILTDTDVGKMIKHDVWKNNIWKCEGKILSSCQCDNPITQDTSIFRIMKYSQLLKNLSKSNNTLIHPSKWFENDQHEKWYLHTFKMTKKYDKKYVIDFMKDVYCQCWSTINGMKNGLVWYPREINKNCNDFFVQIETTVKHLIESLDKVNLNYMIGQVFYIDDLRYMKGLDGERIDNFPLPRIPFDEIESKCIIDVSKMLLIKRKWFKYENEVRLVSIFDNNTNIDYKDDYLLLYKCDISKLIKSITISPFVCRDVFKCITNKIQDKYPSVKCKIYRPDIFDIISEKEQGSYYI